MYLPPSPHPQHPHHLECPRCASRTVVLQGEGRYVCLNCRWERDLVREDWDPVSTFLMALLTVVFLSLVLMFFENQESRNQTSPSVGLESSGEGAIAHPQINAPPNPSWVT